MLAALWPDRHCPPVTPAPGWLLPKPPPSLPPYGTEPTASRAAQTQQHCIEPSHKCNQCGHAFSTVLTMKNHKKTHFLKTTSQMELFPPPHLPSAPIPTTLRHRILRVNLKPPHLHLWLKWPGGDRGAKTGFFTRNRNNIQPSCQNTMHAISGCLPAQDVYQWLLSVKVIQRGPDIIKACDTDEGSLLTKENPTTRT